jgi:hypothetical protein
MGLNKYYLPICELRFGFKEAAICGLFSFHCGISLHQHLIATGAGFEF